MTLEFYKENFKFLPNQSYFLIMKNNICEASYTIERKYMKITIPFKRKNLSGPYIKILEYN